MLLAAMHPALINAQGKEDVTPLHCAVSKQWSAEIVSLLIKHGADVHAKCSLGQTPLFYSIDVASTRILLEASADVNARDYYGYTVLHNAAAQGRSTGVICCLLKAGADATAVNTVYDTAAEVAQAYKHSATAALLSRAARDQHSTH
jgi:uncharacterized protein